LFRLFQ